ncbi:MAG TPA: cupin domain-containing protein [Patescibacteria group bacterium]|nr:cupin domain-containing protein [Patescibacteria group bacterium]
MGNLMTLAEIAPIQVWQGVRARRVQGDRLTLAIVELDPDAEVPEHSHPAEQNGMVIRGEMRFRVGDEERVLGPGGTWRILSGVPHSATAGPGGAVVIDTFSPIRADWDALESLDPSPPRWPVADGP